MSDSLWPREPYSPWISPDQNTGLGSLSLLQGIFLTQGSNPGLPHCRQILYIHESAKPPDKPKNTGVGSLSLLQGIFLTQKSNQDLQHYRQILYHLSHQGSPVMRTHCNSVLCDILSTFTNGIEWGCVYFRPTKVLFHLYIFFIPSPQQCVAHCQCQIDSSQGSEVGAAKCEYKPKVMWIEQISVVGTATDFFFYQLVQCFAIHSMKLESGSTSFT